LTEGYSGADIANVLVFIIFNSIKVCREASLMGMRKRLLNNSSDFESLINKPGFKDELDVPISMSDLLDSLKNISKSVSKLDLKAYDDWTKEFASN